MRVEKPVIEIARKAYHPKMWRNIRGHAGTRLRPAEEEVLLRLASLQEEITLDDKAKVLLEAAFEVLGDRALPPVTKERRSL